jgi:hypothetical protein
MPYLTTENVGFALLLASLPMILAGGWLVHATRTAGQGLPGLQARPRGTGSLLLGALLFLVAWAGTYTGFAVLAMHNVLGLRGEPRHNNPFDLEDAALADGLLLVLLASVVGLVSLVRKRLRLRAEFVAGMWVALLTGGLVILLR